MKFDLSAIVWLNAIFALLTLCCPLPSRAAGTVEQRMLPRLSAKVLQRTVFLGDSITDGNTYPMLVRDALASARVKIKAINAGVGGNTAAMMLARLDGDVFSENPTLVTLFTSANDVGRVTPEEYEKTVRLIIERVQAKKIPIILLTPELAAPNWSEKIAIGFAQYNVILHRLAVEYGLRVAEVGTRMKEDSDAGHNQFAPDGHPNYTGQHSIARAVLDAMGYADIPVPMRVKNKLLPGVIRKWSMRPLTPKEGALTEETVAALSPDTTWVTVRLPEKDPLTGDENLWLDDCRPQGTAIWIKRDVGGETDRYIGVATIKSRTVKKMYFNIGAGTGNIWLNGKKILQPSALRGWHLGRESAIGELQKGKNIIVIETGSNFFLSVTAKPFWQ